jgi:hypothetical protein
MWQAKFIEIYIKYLLLGAGNPAEPMQYVVFHDILNLA